MAEQSMVAHLRAGERAITPIISYAWLRNWRFDYGVSLRRPNRRWKVSHAVLRYKGDYIDNWTRKFGPKSEIEKNHTFHAVYGHGLFHFTVIKMLTSKVVRIFKKR